MTGGYDRDNQWGVGIEVIQKEHYYNYLFTLNFGQPRPVCILSVVILLYNDERGSVNLFSPLEICSKYQHQYDTKQFPFALFSNQPRNKDTFKLVSFRRIEAIRL